MNTIFLNKIMHLATGLASIGFAALCVLAAFFAVTIAAIAFLLIASLGLLVYGIPAYFWGAVSVIQERLIVEPPVLLMRVGLLIALIGLLGVLAS